MSLYKVNTSRILTHLTSLQYKHHIRFTLSAGVLVATMVEALSLARQLKLLRMGQEICMSLILAITVCKSLMTASDSFS